MVARSVTVCGLVSLAETIWNDLLHTRLKPVICPDELVVLDDDILDLEDNPGLYSDFDTGSGALHCFLCFLKFTFEYFVEVKDFKLSINLRSN